MFDFGSILMCTGVGIVGLLLGVQYLESQEVEEVKKRECGEWVHLNV
jgi:hypothetical protein